MKNSKFFPFFCGILGEKIGKNKEREEDKNLIAKLLIETEN